MIKLRSKITWGSQKCNDDVKEAKFWWIWQRVWVIYICLSSLHCLNSQSSLTSEFFITSCNEIRNKKVIRSTRSLLEGIKLWEEIVIHRLRLSTLQEFCFLNDRSNIKFIRFLLDDFPKRGRFVLLYIHKKFLSKRTFERLRCLEEINEKIWGVSEVFKNKCNPSFSCRGWFFLAEERYESLVLRFQPRISLQPISSAYASARWLTISS
jgi:hypothetical protein